MMHKGGESRSYHSGEGIRVSRGEVETMGANEGKKAGEDGTLREVKFKLARAQGIQLSMLKDECRQEP